MKNAILCQEPRSIADFDFWDRFFRKLSNGTPLSAFRKLRFSVSQPMEALQERIISLEGFVATCFGADELLLESDTQLVHLACRGGARSSTLSIEIWAGSVEQADLLKGKLESLFADVTVNLKSFWVDWHFRTQGVHIDNVLIEESADGPLLDQAYPSIVGGVQSFIKRYLDADQPILVLHGPPGTGKTRLVRSILTELSHRKKVGEKCMVMFTADEALMHSDELFLQFIGSGHDAFVIEDADHLLRPRNDGNHALHRFLTISDGIVRAQGRKIIFTSNLPNLGDIDEALMRPGRCFASLTLPRLAKPEVERLLPKLSSDRAAVERVAQDMLQGKLKSLSLAEIYNSLMPSGQQANGHSCQR